MQAFIGKLLDDHARYKPDMDALFLNPAQFPSKTAICAAYITAYLKNDRIWATPMQSHPCPRQRSSRSSTNGIPMSSFPRQTSLPSVINVLACARRWTLPPDQTSISGETNWSSTEPMLGWIRQSITRIGKPVIIMILIDVQANSPMYSLCW